MKILYTLFLIFIIGFANLNAKHSLVNVKIQTPEQQKSFLNSDFDFESAIVKNNEVSIIVNDYELKLIEKLGITYDILIDNLEAYYVERNQINKDELDKIQKPLNFKYGSLNGFFTLDECYSEMDNLIKQNPNLIKKFSIGKSFQKRDIWGYYIGTQKGDGTDEQPYVLYTAMHHAREPGGMMSLIYFLNDLLDKYNKNDDEVVNLLKTRNIIMVPVVNPDGYLYNQAQSPNGGGMFRKNCRTINDTIYGVDLNRNYGPQEFWSTEGGASSDPLRDTYRGESPFSEPETQAIEALCKKYKFKAALNYHTYGNLLIYPYGSLNKETEDSSVYRGFAYYVHKQHKYTYGLDQQALNYFASGNSDDWMYLETNDKPKIFAMTPEVGDQLDGFWPKAERIPVHCIETLGMNYELLRSIYSNTRPMQLIAKYKNMDIPDLELIIKNIGLYSTPKTVFINLKSLNPNIKVKNESELSGGLQPGMIDKITFNLEIIKPITNGQKAFFEVEISEGSIAKRDTFSIFLIKPQIYDLMSEQLSDRWASSPWVSKIENEELFYTDALDSISTRNFESYLSAKLPISLKNVSRAVLSFDARWGIEPYYDAGVVQISTDGGLNWNYLMTDRMVLGLGLNKSRQEKDMPVFHGFIHDWTRQEIDLDSYLDKDIFIRFAVLTDNGVERSGLALKNIKVLIYKPINDVDEDNITNLTIHPNPVTWGNYFSVSTKETFSPKHYKIVDVLGRIVWESDNHDPVLNINSSNLSPGSYLLIINEDDNSYYERFVVN